MHLTVEFSGRRFDVIELLDQPIPESAIVPARSPIQFNNSIELKNLIFRSLWILKDVNLEIIAPEEGNWRHRMRKTTLPDIIMDCNFLLESCW